MPFRISKNMNAMRLSSNFFILAALLGITQSTRTPVQYRAEHLLCLNTVSPSQVFWPQCHINRHHSTRNGLGENGYAWTYDPICMIDATSESVYCVYTDTQFGNGRGISLIGTPQSVQSVAQLSVFTTATPRRGSGNYSTSNSLFEVRSLPSKGLGLVASRTIQPGERLFENTAVVAMQASVENIFDKDDIAFLLHNAVANLPEPTRKLYMALHGHFGGDEIYDRLNTNAFNIFDYAAVFPETSRLNHACRPNAHYYFDRKSFTHHVNTIREVAPGEEITISYISHYLNSTQRTERITKQWGFACDCSLCKAPAEHLKVSDNRIKLISNVEKALDNVKSSSERKPALLSVQTLVSLYEQEELHAPVAQAYIYAALEYSYAGNKTMAQLYAQRAIDTGKLWTGPRSRDVKDMTSLLRYPEKHSSWMRKVQKS